MNLHRGDSAHRGRKAPGIFLKNATKNVYTICLFLLLLEGADAWLDNKGNWFEKQPCAVKKGLHINHVQQTELVNFYLMHI